MIKLNTIQPAAGSHRETKRLGRGQGSGQGCTGGKGNKGAKSRRGARNKLYFEGGQTPMTRRIPKRGFNNTLFRNRYQILNVRDVDKADVGDKEIDPQWLFDNGLVRSNVLPVKVLGSGDVSKRFTIRAHVFSKSAREKIEKAKGKVEVIARA